MRKLKIFLMIILWSAALGLAWYWFNYKLSIVLFLTAWANNYENKNRKQ